LSSAFDAAKCGQRPIDHGLRRRRLAQIGIDDQRFRAGGLHRRGRLVQMSAVPRHEDQRGEIACEADGGGPADTLAGTCDDGY
jgi:hypothetical protein